MEIKHISRKNKNIKNDILDNFTWDSRIDESQIDLKVDKNNNVTVSGTIENYEIRRAILARIISVEGVNKIINKLEIEHPEELEMPSNEKLESIIEEAIENHADLRNENLNVSVNNGIVTVKGTVSSFWKKEAARDLICCIFGIKDFTNEIAVFPSDKKSDEEIAEELTAAITRNMAADIQDIEISVNKETVYLTGTVLDSFAHKTIENLAGFTKGVKEVKNNLKVVKKRDIME
ncbi:MAG: BON domain-containing protein [Asgard group archaeon]|nr:BON domain-containing protein [Asgard group archaeon]